MRSMWAKQEDQNNFQEQKREKQKRNAKNCQKTVRCTLLNGSAWSTVKKYMTRCTGT